MKPTHDSLLLRVTGNHVLVSLASPFYDLALFNSIGNLIIKKISKNTHH